MTWISIIVGVVAWFATHFVGRPFLKVYEYREKAHEIIYYTGSIGEITLKDDPKAYQNAVNELRRLAAQLMALAASMPFFYNRVLGCFRINLVNAARGLTGLSNSLATKDGSKLVHRETVEKALRLPPSNPYPSKSAATSR